MLPGGAAGHTLPHEQAVPIHVEITGHAAESREGNIPLLSFLHAHLPTQPPTLFYTKKVRR